MTYDCSKITYAVKKLRLCFNATTETKCQFELGAHSSNVKLRVTGRNCSCFAAICFSNFVSTVSKIIYISLSLLLLLLECNHQFLVLQKMLSQTSRLFKSLYRLLMLLILKLRERCIKLIYGEKDYRVCNYDKRVKGVYCCFFCFVCAE